MGRTKGGRKRSEMTQEELAQVRKLDRDKKQKRRMNLSEEEKNKIREKDRKSRAEERKNMEEEEKERIRAIDRVRKAERRKKGRKEDEEKVKINDLIRKRRTRLMETEGEKQLYRDKAKIGMRVLRKEGPMRKYQERNKQHKWAVKWKKFLSQNPMFRELEEKKKTKRR